MKNYYIILGVQSDATHKQIREAYRRLAKELHPDYYGQDSGPFIDLQEAFAVLSDPARRRAYDANKRNAYGEQGSYDASSYDDPATSGRARAEPLFTRSSTSSPEPLIPYRDQADLRELSLTRSFRTFGPSFEELFDRLWRNFSLIRPGAGQLRSLNVEIRISPKEALQGGRTRILVPARLRCPDCHGHGGLGFFECWRCHGAGVVQGEYPVTLAFPPGIINNYVAEIPLDRFGISNFYLRVIFRVSRD